MATSLVSELRQKKASFDRAPTTSALPLRTDIGTVARGRITARLINVPRCLIGIEAGMATHYVARELRRSADAKQVPPAYAKPFRQGHKNDFRDAHAIAEAVQRPSIERIQHITEEIGFWCMAARVAAN